MQLTYLHIRNFKSIRDLEIRGIDRALILVGKNNTGKTSVLDAVCAVCGLSASTDVLMCGDVCLGSGFPPLRMGSCLLPSM